MDNVRVIVNPQSSEPVPGMENITYEQPLNERVRTFLRLEFLFQQTDHALKGTSQWDSRAALASLLDIHNIFVRSDIKTEVIKELERETANLAPLEQVPGIDKQRLNKTLDDMDLLNDKLHLKQGQIGQSLRDNEFISNVKQRSSIPGGTCDFDLPAYHYWLHQDAGRRMADMKQWLSEFDTIRSAIELILRQIRESAITDNQIAENGFYQQNLDASTPFQLIRVTLPVEAGLFAEISGGKHRFSIRFMNMHMRDRPVQTERDVEFSLACCAL